MITIFTPTYNRAHTLERLYESLKKQTYTKFEWLIIDDGSHDDTSVLVSSFIDERQLTIKYHFQPNAGKHVAINTGAIKAKYNWFFIVDSDDLLLPHAVRTICDSVISNDNSKLYGICFRKAYLDMKVVGSNICDPVSSYMHPSVANKFFNGDLAYVFKTDVLRKLSFPVVAGEKFVPEQFLWNRIGDHGLILYHHDIVIYLCEYLEDGYTANFKRNIKANPNGFLIYYQDQIKREQSLVARAKLICRVMQCYIYSIVNKSFQ